MHDLRHHHLLLHRQRHPRVRPARLPDWRAFRYPDVLPSHGLHVALRQLETQDSHEPLEVPLRLQRLHPRWWKFPSSFRNLRRGYGYHRCLQPVWWVCCVDLRGQLQLCLKRSSLRKLRFPVSIHFRIFGRCRSRDM